MERIVMIDNLRGIAFLFMLFQHIFYFYDVSTEYKTSYSNNTIVEYSGFIARTMFILLAGYSVYLTYKKQAISEIDKKDKLKKRVKRSGEILEHAILISMVTYLLYPEKFIKFGILHFLALGTLLVSFVAPNKTATIVALIISLIIPYPVTGTFADVVTGSHFSGQMMDWFPLNRWIPVLLSGVAIGQYVDVKIPVLEFNNMLTDIGKNSLNLYTIHLIGLLVMFKYLN
jgi:uncharacterized membrane protein